MTVHPQAEQLYQALSKPPAFARGKKFFERKAGANSAFTHPPKTARATTHQGPIAIVNGGKTVLQVRNAPPNFAWSDPKLDLSKYDIGAYAVDSALTNPRMGVTREQLMTAGNDPLTITFQKNGSFHDASLPSRARALAFHPEAEKLYEALPVHPTFTGREKFFGRKAGANSVFTRPPKTPHVTTHRGPIAIVGGGKVVLQVRNAPPNFMWSDPKLDLSKYDIGAYAVDSALTNDVAGVTREKLITAGNDSLTITFQDSGAFRNARLPSRATVLAFHPEAEKLYEALPVHPIFTGREKFFGRKAGANSVFTRPPKTPHVTTHRGPIAIVGGGKVVLQVRNPPPNFMWSDPKLDLSKYDIGAYAVDSALTSIRLGVTREKLITAGNDSLTITFQDSGAFQNASFPSRATALTDRLYEALPAHPVFTVTKKFFERKAGKESVFTHPPKTPRATTHQGPIAIVNDGKTVLQVRNPPPDFAWSDPNLDLSRYDIGAYAVDSALTSVKGIPYEQLMRSGNDSLSIAFQSSGAFQTAWLPSRATAPGDYVNPVGSNASLAPNAPDESSVIQAPEQSESDSNKPFVRGVKRNANTAFLNEEDTSSTGLGEGTNTSYGMSDLWESGTDKVEQGLLGRLQEQFTAISSPEADEGIHAAAMLQIQAIAADANLQAPLTALIQSKQLTPEQVQYIGNAVLSSDPASRVVANNTALYSALWPLAPTSGQSFDATLPGNLWDQTSNFYVDPLQSEHVFEHESGLIGQPIPGSMPEAWFIPIPSNWSVYPESYEYICNRKGVIEGTLWFDNVGQSYLQQPDGLSVALPPGEYIKTIADAQARSNAGVCLRFNIDPSSSRNGNLIAARPKPILEESLLTLLQLPHAAYTAPPPGHAPPLDDAYQNPFDNQGAMDAPLPPHPQQHQRNPFGQGFGGGSR